LINLASSKRCASALAASVFSSDILRSRCFFGLTEGSIPKLCLIPKLAASVFSDQVEGGLGKDVFIFGQTAEESLLVMRSEVFADGDHLLGRCLVEGNSLGPIVALQLCLVMLFGGWAGRLGDLALGREAVYVPLPRNEVSFYVARGLLVVVDCDRALRTWDLHA
jgi:hypothetical protein